MSNPVRFIASGLLLCASTLTLQPQLATRRLDRVSQAMGLLYLSIALWLGLKRDDAMLRGFGLAFLAINLYTRFFEFFWDAMPKTIFFLLLGISLWLLGRHAERIWRLGHHENDVTH